MRSKMIELPKKTSICLLLAAMVLMSACATAPKKEEKDQTLSKLQDRLEESERRNKRLDKKIDQLEGVIAATKDRLDAQTLASQYNYQQQHQPDPVPESHFSNGLSQQSYPTYKQNYGRSQRRPRRILLSSPTHYTDDQLRQPVYSYEGDPIPENTDAETIIITQDDYDAFVGSPNRDLHRRSEPRRGKASSSGRVAQPNVTEERLSFSDTPARKENRPMLGADRSNQPTPEYLRVYEEGLSFYRSGDYKSALRKFQAFLKQDPNPTYLDNALYWIGESYYGLNKMDESIRYFKRVIQEVPDGNKVPNALLKMAIAYRNLGQFKNSKKLLTRVVKKYPTSGAGQIAKRELEKLQ